MPDISTSAQVFDISFHPTESLVFVGLLTGGIKAFRYDEQGRAEEKFSIRPSKRSCRGLACSEDGSHIFAVGKGKAMHTIDTGTGRILETRTGIHQAPINRIKYLTPHLLSTGDDDGVVKLWDPRKPEEIRSYNHHFDFISDFMWTGTRKELVVTSGDGTLSVIDVRSKKPGPVAQSEDQEDELLSIAPIRNGEKTVVGTQQGILSIFNRSSGWGDCVDRVPGHPHSIDALHPLPSSYPSSHSTLLTGSSDGLLRAVQLFPTKLLGVVADHGDFPIERIAIDRSGEGHWVGSVGHDEVIKLTDLREVFEDEDGNESGDEDEGGDEDKDEDGDGDGDDDKAERVDDDNGGDEDTDEGGSEGRSNTNAVSTDNRDSTKNPNITRASPSPKRPNSKLPQETNTSQPSPHLASSNSNSSSSSSSDSDSDSSSDSDSDSGSEPLKKKRRKKVKDQDPLETARKKKRKARNDEVSADPSFFADL